MKMNIAKRNKAQKNKRDAQCNCLPLADQCPGSPWAAICSSHLTPPS